MTRAKNKPKTGLLRKTILVINMVCIGLLVLAYATPYIPVSTWGWLAVLALAYPFLMLVNGAFAVLWIIGRKWYAVLSILVMLAGYPHHVRYVKLFSAGESKGLCQESIRIMSYNLRGLSLVASGNGHSRWDDKIDTLLHALKALDEFPDILCLQEVSQGDRMTQKMGLDHSYHAPKSTLWLLSRYPIIQQGVVAGQETSPCAQWADLKTPQGTLRVYNMHLVSNRVTNTAEGLIEDMNLQQETTWQRIGFILRRYKYTTELRSLEAQAIQQHILDCPHPVIVAGDGNDPPLSYTYTQLLGRLKDGFSERGLGTSTTYRSKLPLLRIDYLLGSDQIDFKDYSTHKISHSDHYPVSAGICIRESAGS